MAALANINQCPQIARVYNHCTSNSVPFPPTEKFEINLSENLIIWTESTDDAVEVKMPIDGKKYPFSLYPSRPGDDQNDFVQRSSDCSNGTLTTTVDSINPKISDSPDITNITLNKNDELVITSTFVSKYPLICKRAQ